MSNPNEYNDEAFLQADMALHDAIASMWEAGASEDNIMDSVKNAIQNVE